MPRRCRAQRGNLQSRLAVIPPPEELVKSVADTQARLYYWSVQSQFEQLVAALEAARVEVSEPKTAARFASAGTSCWPRPRCRPPGRPAPSPPAFAWLADRMKRSGSARSGRRRWTLWPKPSRRAVAVAIGGTPPRGRRPRPGARRPGRAVSGEVSREVGGPTPAPWRNSPRLPRSWPHQWSDWAFRCPRARRAPGRHGSEPWRMR